MITNSQELNLFPAPMFDRDTISVGEFFAGSGGVTHAMENIPGMKVKWVLNHDKTAIRTNIFHHKEIKHYWADVYAQDEHEMEPVDFIWASIECTQHSRAKGGGEKNIGSYTMGYELVRYIKHLMPLIIGIENVPEFKKWAPCDETGKPDKKRIGEEFELWKKTITDLGYEYSESIRNAADDGMPTRRVRYFAFFIMRGLCSSFPWPEHTHSKNGTDGKEKWMPCRPYINVSDEGKSIFGRKKPLCQNTLKRIAGGIRKFAPDLQFIFQYYGTGTNVQSTEKPLNTVTTKDRHVLVSYEKIKFIQDHCHQDHYCGIDEPISPQLTRQNKQIVTANASFISKQYNSNGNPGANNHGLEDPLGAITTKEKMQFITTYFNSSGNPGSQNQSIDAPLNTILTGTNKKGLISVIGNILDFDIKMRFLSVKELSLCSTFPGDYFTKEGLRLSTKDAVRLIGNAVPPLWAQKLISPAVNILLKFKKTKAA